MDREPRQQQAPPPPNFRGFDHVLEQFVQNELPINEIQQLARNTNVVNDPSTWESSTDDGEQGAVTIRIGEQALPPEIRRMFGWGTETKEQDYVVKFAHEYAHAVQGEFEASLMRFLTKTGPLIEGDIPESHVPFLQLYSELQDIGGLFGLSSHPFYHQQNENMKAEHGYLPVDIKVIEDMAELIGSYLLGTEYFLHRIGNTRARITQEQAKRLAGYVVTVVDTWIKKKGG